MTSRPPARHRFEDDDDDDFIPQAPRRDQNLEKGPVGDKGDHQHHKKDRQHHHHNEPIYSPVAEKMSAARPSRGQYGAVGALPVEMKPRTGAGTSPRREDHQTELVARPHVKNKDVDMEEIKAAARSSAAHFYPGIMEANKATRPITTQHDAVAMKTSAMGLAALASTSVTHSMGTARASNVDGLDSTEEAESEKKPHARVGAVVVQGLSPRNTSHHSSSFSDVSSTEVSSPPPPVPGEGYSLQATLVADHVTSYNEEADIASQAHSRKHREAEDIANMVRRQLFPDPAMVVVHTKEEPDRRKRKWILLAVAVLVIAGAIAAGVAIPLLHDDNKTNDDENTTPEPTDPLGAFRSVLESVSEEGLYDPNSPQYKALDWIVNKDLADLTVGVDANETIRQRYVAAVLYFALDGENWNEKYNFLSEDDICLWNQNQTSGIICDQDNVRVETLNMSKNRLSGRIPEEIGHFSDLSTIAMTYGMITGTLPSSLEHLSLLAELDLTACKLVGTIPDFLYTHPSLTKLLLDDNSFTGTIPPSLGTSPLLWAFWVMNNQLTGSIPASVGQSSFLWSVDLSGNSLTGTIPYFSPTSQMRYVSLENNTLYGSIPSSIGNVQYLQYILLRNTQMGGMIPTELGQCQNLQLISFEINQLTGDIGPIINILPPSLTSLDLTFNRLSGTVPISIGVLTDLEFLDLGSNSLIGTIPSELGLLRNLEVLALYMNGFNGTVPTSLASLPLLKTFDIFDNNLTGSLDAFCGIVFERFAANTCEQVTINCSCCTDCCEPKTGFCEPV